MQLTPVALPRSSLVQRRHGMSIVERALSVLQPRTSTLTSFLAFLHHSTNGEHPSLGSKGGRLHLVQAAERRAVGTQPDGEVGCSVEGDQVSSIRRWAPPARGQRGDRRARAIADDQDPGDDLHGQGQDRHS